VIAALRRRHAQTWILLAVLLPALLVFALRVRASRPSDALPAFPPALLAAAGAVDSTPAAGSGADTGVDTGADTDGDTDGGAEPLLLWEDSRPFAGLDIGARVEAAAGRAPVLTLRPAAAVLEPDVLLYFRAASETGPGPRGAASEGAAGEGAAGGAAADGGLTPSDVLLGALTGALARRYELPAQARAGGELRLYSLAHDATIARATLPPLGAAPAPGIPPAEPPSTPPAAPAVTPPAGGAPR